MGYSAKLASAVVALMGGSVAVVAVSDQAAAPALPAAGTAHPLPSQAPAPSAAPSGPTEPTARQEFDAAGNWQATRLDVPFISQFPDLPTGCEATAVAMMLRYAGANVSQEQVAAEMPYDWDPELGFQGDPYSWDGGIIYPGALLGLVRQHLGSAVDLSGSDWPTIQAVIASGRPVIVWFEPIEGNSHTVVVTGFTADQVLINDPAEGLIDPFDVIADSPGDGHDLVMAQADFLQDWASSNYRALSY
jgi:uncharacterized protein YvpB